MKFSIAWASVIAASAIFLAALSLLWGPLSIQPSIQPVQPIDKIDPIKVKPQAEDNLPAKAYTVYPNLTSAANGVEVRCFNPGEWRWPNYVGWYHWDHWGGVFHNHIKLAPTVCDRINYSLESDVSSEEFLTYQTRFWLEGAWHTFAHEVAHSLGYPESAADCEGEKIDRAVMMGAGLDSDYARALDMVRDWCWDRH